MRYLDPKADLTFKRVFGEHPDLVISFLNALLPLHPGQEVREIEYLPTELVPDNPLRKNSIVDVRCKDNLGRIFIVEMQMIWTPEFKQRVLFNASKAYVRQLKAGKHYELLQPVYSLNLVNDIFELELGNEFYHYYRLVHVEHTDKVIDGLHLIFVELPKFTPQNYADKKMQVLWLRFLTEINDNTRNIPPEFLASPELKKAMTVLEESAFTEEQLAGYEKFWDIISVEKTLFCGAERRGEQRGLEKGLKKGLEQGMKQGIEQGMKQGIEQGLEQGLEQGRKQGLEQGRNQERSEMARKMKEAHLPSAVIAQVTGLTEEEVNAL